MFKRIAAYFAGAPAPVPAPVITAPVSCATCDKLGYECTKHFVPTEPVLSILRAVKTRRKTILLDERITFQRHGSTKYFGFADTVTGRYLTVMARRSTYMQSASIDYPTDIGLSEREVRWLISRISERMSLVKTRAAALAGAKARRELMQEYVK